MTASYALRSETAAELEAEGFGNGGRCAVSPDGRYLAVVARRD
jgi:hypothetical protein